MISINIQEEAFGSNKKANIPISLNSGSLSLKELIRIKIFKRVETINEKIRNNELDSNLTSQKELLLNKYLNTNSVPEVDDEKAFYDALAAFKKNSFFVIVNGQQKTELEEMLELDGTSEILFVRLTPLVGG